MEDEIKHTRTSSDVDLKISWVQGKCKTEPCFLEEKVLLLNCGSFLKLYHLETIKEVTFQEPPNGVQCTGCDADLGLMAIATSKSDIHTLRYPNLDAIFSWKTSNSATIQQLVFTGDHYLLSLEASPSLSLTVWRWQDGQRLARVGDIDVAKSLNCSLSVNPGCKKMIAMQDSKCMHFFQIEDTCKRVKLLRSTFYTPDADDHVGTSFLTDDRVGDLTFFDKLDHPAWGIHSELLHRMPLRVLYPNASDRVLVNFCDKLSQICRTRISCHCWLPEDKVAVACLNGTIMRITVSPLSVEILHSEIENGNHPTISCMALNKDGLFYSTRSGQVFMVQNIDEWSPARQCLLDEFPIQMKMSPNYKSMIFYNDNCTIQLLEPSTKNLVYVLSSTDASKIVGAFIRPRLCASSRRSGLVEVWTCQSGTPAFAFEFREELVCMEGIKACSVLIFSLASSYLYVVEFANHQGFRTVKVSRPGEKPVTVIKPEPFGRLAVLASSDPCVFIYSTLPSKGFGVLGYFVPSTSIEDVVVFSCDVKENILVFLLGHDADGTSSLTKLELPADFVDTAQTFWKDTTGEFKNELLQVLDLDLQLYCCSIVGHRTLGLMLCLPVERAIWRIPLEKFGSLAPEALEKSCGLTEDGQVFQMLLSTNQKLLLIVSNGGTVSIRSTENFDLKFEQKFLSSKNILPFVAFWGDTVLLEGSENELICCKVSNAGEDVNLPWAEHLQQNKKVEDDVLLKMATVIPQESKSWVQDMIFSANKATIEELMKSKEKFNSQLQMLGTNLKTLMNDNLSVPQKHRIDSEIFIFDEDIKEQMLIEREEEIKKHNQEQQAQLDQQRQEVAEIRIECIESMLVRGRNVGSLREGPILQNYSISIMPKEEKEKIQYSHKKMLLDRCLKSGDSVVFKELTFEEDMDEDLKSTFRNILKQPIQQHSIEEKVDHVYILKYVVFKKRLQFNQQFDDVLKLRKSTIEKINEINTRLKEIYRLTGDEMQLWEPRDKDDDHDLVVAEEEVDSTCRISVKNSENCKSLAEDVLNEEWLLKRKVHSSTKYQPKPKKEQAEKLKKEAEKRFAEIDELVEDYQAKHEELVGKKLLCDLDVNQTELQIFMLLFSVSNFHDFRRWECLANEQVIGLGEAADDNDEPASELENRISDLKEAIEKTTKDMLDIDHEVLQMSKTSRNKQALLEAYDKRPETVMDHSLNPYKTPETVASFESMDTIKNKPQKIPLTTWKQLCSLRERKYQLEVEIKEGSHQIHSLKTRRRILKHTKELAQQEILEKQQYLQDLHDTRIRCNYETPMVLNVTESQLEVEHPEDLDFRQTLFLKKYHAESLNCLLSNVGKKTLETVQKIAKANLMVEKNEATVRRNRLKLRDASKEIEVIKNLPLTKDVQKIVQDPRGFRLQDRMDAMESSKKKEMDDYAKQLDHVARRISSIEVKKDILKKSLKEKKKDIEKLKGDIAELKILENLGSSPK